MHMDKADDDGSVGLVFCTGDGVNPIVKERWAATKINTLLHKLRFNMISSHLE